MMRKRAREEANAYLEFLRSGDEPALGSAWENVQDAIDNAPQRAWSILLWAVALSREPAELAFIGAGPLETLLVNRREYVDRALRVAARHDKFRQTLRSADIRGAAADDVARVDRFFES
jgi:hypothetical protein